MIDTSAMGSAHAALVDAQHQRRLNDAGQRLHLLVAEHCLEHGGGPPAQFGRVRHCSTVYWPARTRVTPSEKKEISRKFAMLDTK